MKKKKTISLKSPKLRKIRNNLRMLLLEWGTKQLNELFDARDMIERNVEGKIKLDHELASGDIEKIDNLSAQITEIRKIKNASICKCTVCGAPDRDMTYNPIVKEWFCVDCYKLNQDFYKDTDQAYLYP